MSRRKSKKSACYLIYHTDHNDAADLWELLRGIQVAHLFAELVRHGMRTIAFCTTRKLSELVLQYAHEALKASGQVDILKSQLATQSMTCHSPQSTQSAIYYNFQNLFSNTPTRRSRRRGQWTFWKVGCIVMVYSRLRSELTFENFNVASRSRSFSQEWELYV